MTTLWSGRKAKGAGRAIFAIASMDVNGDSSMTDLDWWRVAISTATAQPSDRPNSISLSISTSPRERRYSMAASPSMYIPRSDGLPSLRPYPR